MEFATWVLVIITAMYVVLTGGLVLIGWLQLRRESNPVVYPRVQSASVAVDGEQPCLNMKLTLAVLGRTPATNVVLRGTLQVLSTSATDARSAEFRSGALPVLGVGESDPPLRTAGHRRNRLQDSSPQTISVSGGADETWRCILGSVQSSRL